MPAIAREQTAEPCQEQPNAWIVVGPTKFPACIRRATFNGGIIETGADIEAGQLLPLSITNGEDSFTVHVHLLAGKHGIQPFKLYGTNGTPRSLWDALVRKRRDRGLK